MAENEDTAERDVPKPDRAGIENLRVLENIEVQMTVEVGRAKITIRDLLRLNEGSVIELDRLAGDPLDILINGTMIAKGEFGQILITDTHLAQLKEVFSTMPDVAVKYFMVDAGTIRDIE